MIRREPYTSREDWLERRRQSIGGSDAGAILGLNRHVSPLAVWGCKTGRLPPSPDTESMRVGRDLEEYVSRRWCEETGKRVRRCGAILRNDDYPFAHANPDRLVIGEKAGLEVKTMSDTFAAAALEGGKIPPHYYVQTVHYLAVTGLERWYLAILAFGRGLFTFTIERDEAEIAALMEAERHFWEDYVVPEIPPPPDGLPATSDALGRLYPDSQPKTVALPDELLFEYVERKAASEAADRLLEESRQRIQLAMGTSESGEGGGFVVNWKTRTRTSIDAKRLLADHPEIPADKYAKSFDYRTFSVKEG